MKQPSIHPSTFVADTSVIIGDVRIGKKCGVYPYAVIRGDRNHIEIGDGSNVQDCCVLHVDADHSIHIGANVSIGHLAMVHGATIHDNCIIGIHATILNGAVINKGCIIGANALVTSDTEIPENSLVLGIPGKVIKQDDSYQIRAHQNAEVYQELSAQYLRNLHPTYQQLKQDEL
jgi:carbonic anhydrase/acetyltransferase-like protein (isoleucine patch superfamily)